MAVFAICFTAVLIICNPVEALSGTFYTDNGHQQTVLFKTLGKRDKIEFQEELLNLLGLHHSPNNVMLSKRNKSNILRSSAETFLLDVYKTLTDEEENINASINKSHRSLLRKSDFIVSFVNKSINQLIHKRNHPQTEKSCEHGDHFKKFQEEKRILEMKLKSTQEDLLMFQKYYTELQKNFNNFLSTSCDVKHVYTQTKDGQSSSLGENVYSEDSESETEEPETEESETELCTQTIEVTESHFRREIYAPNFIVYPPNIAPEPPVFPMMAIPQTTNFMSPGNSAPYLQQSMREAVQETNTKTYFMRERKNN